MMWLYLMGWKLHLFNCWYFTVLISIPMLIVVQKEIKYPSQSVSATSKDGHSLGLGKMNIIACSLTLDAGLLARSQYPEGPATGHLDTGFSWFPCVYKRMLKWFPSFQVATTCLSCSPPDLNFLVTFFPHLCTCKITTATG